MQLGGRQDLDQHAVRKKGVRTITVVLSIAGCLALVAAAQADVGLTLTTIKVRSGGILRGHGSGSGMPVYPRAGEPRAAPVPLSRWQGLPHAALAASARQAIRPARASTAHALPVHAPAIRLPRSGCRPWSVSGRLVVSSVRTHANPGGFDTPRSGGLGPPLDPRSRDAESHIRSV